MSLLIVSIFITSRYFIFSVYLFQPQCPFSAFNVSFLQTVYLFCIQRCFSAASIPFLLPVNPFLFLVSPFFFQYLFFASSVPCKSLVPFCFVSGVPFFTLNAICLHIVTHIAGGATFLFLLIIFYVLVSLFCTIYPYSPPQCFFSASIIPFLPLVYLFYVYFFASSIPFVLFQNLLS